MIWDKLWYETGKIEKINKRPEYPLLVHTLKRGKINRILDVGCGSGSWLFHLQKTNYDAIGVDISKVALHKASLYGIKNLMLADARFLPFRKEKFDLILCFGLVEHFRKKDRLLIYHCFYEVLSKRGRLIVDVPNLFSLRSLLILPILRLTRKTKYGYERGYSIKKLFSEFLDAGFIIVEYGTLDSGADIFYFNILPFGFYIVKLIKSYYAMIKKILPKVFGDLVYIIALKM